MTERGIIFALMIMTSDSNNEIINHIKSNEIKNGCNIELELVIISNIAATNMMNDPDEERDEDGSGLTISVSFSFSLSNHIARSRITNSEKFPKRIFISHFSLKVSLIQSGSLERKNCFFGDLT